MRDDQIYNYLRNNSRETVAWVQAQNKMLSMQLLFLHIKMKFYEELLQSPWKTVWKCIRERIHGREWFQYYLKDEFEKFQTEELKKCSLNDKKETPVENS
jgi:hypothetical protein